MRAAAVVLAIFGAACAVQAGPRQPEAQLFAAHDCCGRLLQSEIAKVGEMRSGRRTFRIYSLWFVNPQSLHGMRRIALTEGNEFRGSYIISSSAMPVVQNGIVKFVCDNGAACESDDFAIKDGKLPSELWVDGEVHQLENTI